MTIESIQKICMAFKGATQDIKWEDHLCFSVGAKMFLITSPDNVPPTASFKVSDEDFEVITSRAGFTPAPYLARYKWVLIEDISLLSEKEWTTLLRKSYQLIAEKLPVKTKNKLGIN